MTKTIKLLDERTINKIAAGEVVQRPSSVVKELVENSIDAESTCITIEISNGGKKYIRITDDGVGIGSEYIETAFLRHSTSKISKVEDLESVYTLGFRGEALASIAAVSQLEIITRTSNDLSGVKAVINGGVVREKVEVGCPKGTTIIVKNLFFNVPVRQSFLKNDNTESSHISDIIYKLAISNPNISFNYIKDNKQVIKTPGKGDIKSTAYSILGKEFINSTFEINNSLDDISIKGLICKPSFTRGNRSSQYIFVNGRYIKDEGISKSIENGYKTLVPVNRFPAFLIFIDINSNKVDVNVHPTKTEVRFSNKDKLTKLLYDSIKSTLISNDLIPEVPFSKEPSRNKNLNIIEEQIVIDSPKQSIDLPMKKCGKRLLDEIGIYRKGNDEDVGIKNISENLKVIDFSSSEEVCEKQESKYNTYSPKLPKISVIGRLFNTYILGEDKENKVFYLIDQHAAHERVMYEKIKKELSSQEVYTQNLLSPEIIELNNREVILIKDNINIFSKLGFNIEEFGNKSIAIRGVPLVFGEPNCKKLFLDILDNLESSIQSNYDLQLEKIMKLACTSSIKAKDNIEDIEIKKLIEDLELTEEPFTCPHGRPIIIKMTNYELEKKFKRT